MFLNSCYSKGEENFKKVSSTEKLNPKYNNVLFRINFFEYFQSLNITLTQPLMIVVFREVNIIMKTNLNVFSKNRIN